MKPYYEDPSVTIYHGDCFDVLHDLAPGTIGAVVTDPPYSSGGAFRGDRAMQTSAKYVNSDVQAYRPEFAGDNRDQRGFLIWCSMWLTAARVASSPGAVLASFVDWRQLPTLTDAVQVAGWVWRGVAVWSKGFGRPTPGRFSNAAEYVVWGSNGPMGEREAYPPGVFQQPSVVADKVHIAQKPIEVMRWVMQIVPPGSLVVDPFMGSGTTLRAAKDCGLRAVGIDSDERWCEEAAKRMGQEVLFGP